MTHRNSIIILDSDSDTDTDQMPVLESKSSSSSSSSELEEKKPAVVPKGPKLINYDSDNDCLAALGLDETDEFAHLKRYGYQVISEPVMTGEECDERIDELWRWMESLDRGIDRTDPSTWSSKHWPASVHGIVQYPSAAHTEAVWKVRSHPNVVNAFARLWKVQPEDLRTSFDRVCIQRPTERTQNQKTWMHIDQGPLLIGKFACAQGFVTLADMPAEGGTLVVMPGSHIHHEAFFKAFPERISKVNEKTGKVVWFTDNWVRFTEDELTWWASKGCKPVRVSARKGQLVLWDSRTCHQGSYPLPKSPPRWRWVVYVCAKPLPQAANGDVKSRKALDLLLGKKRKAFEESRTTSHWPVPEPYVSNAPSAKRYKAAAPVKWRGSKLFAVKPQYSQDQKPEPDTAAVVRTADELAEISPLAPILAGLHDGPEDE